MPQQQRFQKIASTIPLPTAEPLQAQQCQSQYRFVSTLVEAQTCSKTYATNSGCRELCGWSSTMKSDQFQTSDTYHLAKATTTKATGFGRLSWCLLDNNLLWRQLTWRAHILIIWLRWLRLIPLRGSIIARLVWRRWTTIIRRGSVCRGRTPGFIRLGIGRGTERRRYFLYVIGGEEPLISIDPASPPIGIRFSNYFDDIASAEG